MVAARRPLVPGLRTLEDQQLGRIGLAASSLREQLQQGRSMAEALQTLDHQTGPQLAAAFRAAVDSGDAEPLYRLAELLRRRRELTIGARVALLYPIMLLLLGYAFLVLVFAPLVTQDQTAIKIWPAAVVAVGQWLTAYWYLPPLVVGVVGSMWWVGMRNSPWGSPQSLLPGRFGRLSLFCQTVAMQIEANVPQPIAIRSAAGIGGDRCLEQMAIGLAARLEQGESGGAVSGAVARGRWAYDPLPPMLVWLLRQAAGLGGESTAAQLRSLGQWYEQRERDRHRLWARWVPAVLVSVIGGSFVLAYLLMALLPIYNRLAGIG